MILRDFRPGTTPKHKFQLTPHQQMLLMPVGDVHAWSDGWPEDRFRDHIKWGVSQGAYFLGMGEYLDFTSTSQRDILRKLRGSQQKQLDGMLRTAVERLAKLMKPSRGRWLGMLEGHHYHQFQDGTTTDQYLCQLLDAPFLGTSTLMTVRLGRPSGGSDGCDVIIFAHHGCGSGGRKQGSHLHKLEDLLGWIEADIYLMGHTHAKVTSPVDRLYRTHGGYLYHRTKILARTGGFLRGYVAHEATERTSTTVPADTLRGGYVEQAALAPSALGGIVLSLGYKRIVESGGKVDLTVPDLHFSV